MSEAGDDEAIELRYRAAGGVVVDGEGRVLVLLRDSRGEVRLPKGHVEAGESDAAAAVREVGEESGYVDVEIVADLGSELVEFETTEFGRSKGRLHRVRRDERYFLMRLASPRSVQRDPAELKFEPVWMAPGEAAAAMTYDAERRRVEQAVRLLGS